MSFSNTLKSNSVNEWKDYYLDYERLRVRTRNKDFRKMLYNEVNKVNSFYFLLEKKAVDEKNSLFNEIIAELPGDYVYDSKAQTENTDGEIVRKKDPDDPEGLDIDAIIIQKKDDQGSRSFLQADGLANLIPMKNGYTKRKQEKHITEFLHSLVKIKAYRDLNATGLIKLARKYADLNKDTAFYEKFNEKLKETYFYKSKRIDSIRNAVKKMYKRVFAKDQPEKAKSMFRRLSRGSKRLEIFYLISGIMIGIAFAILARFQPENAAEIQESNFKFTCAMNNIFLGFLCFGLCLKAFKNCSINYKFIFNFDVVSTLNNSIFFLIVSSLLLINNALFLINDSFGKYLAYVQVAIPIIFLFNPFDILFLNSRMYVIGVFARSFFLPFSTIRFRHFYFVDVLQSFRFPLEIVIPYMISASSNGVYPLAISCFFPAVRIMQCLKRFSLSRLFFPHIANVFKYIFVLMVILTEVLQKISTKDNLQAAPEYLYIVKNILRTISTISSFFWDILVDWVIFRNRYTFPTLFYRFALVFNFGVRFYWMAVLFSKSFLDVQLPHNDVILSALEICRRSIWTIIRVEVEHLNNCDELKIKKSINLTAGELFYKKDIEESYQTDMSNLETEFETEMEDDGRAQEKEVRIEIDENTVTEDDSQIEYEDDNRETSESHEEEE